ncbi:MAG: hypothetical protein ACM3S1_11560, partial [Hyphomicrobiales bacterium]
MPASNQSAFAEFRARYQSIMAGTLPERVARLRWTKPQVLEHQRRHLRELLTFARDHSPFYAERLRGLDLETFEPADLPKLPTLLKAELMAHFGDVVTDRELTRGLAEDALAASRTEPVPALGRYLALVSGGSSGQRGVFVADAQGVFDMQSSIVRGLFVQILRGGLP